MDHDAKFWEQVNGNQLNPDEVVAALLDEIEQLHTHDVYDKVPLTECRQSTGRAPVKAKWVGSHEGNNVSHKYRNRPVAKENKMDKRLDKRLDFLAAIPPLEAKNQLFSAATTEGVGLRGGNWQSGMKIDVIDIRRAVFHADAIRAV